MGILDRIFGRKSSQVEDELANAGLKVIQDKVLSERLDDMARVLSGTDNKFEFQNWLKSQSEVVKLDLINDIAGGPWGRSGDNPRYYKAYISLRKLVSYYNFMAEGLSEDEKKELADMVVVPWIRMLLQASFRDKDVTPNVPITIHTQPPVIKKEPITGKAEV